jgi:hypothetical protein
MVRNVNLVPPPQQIEGDKGLKIDCGAQPTGFAISGTTADVIFELFVKGSKTKASYAGPQGGGPVVSLNTCLNGKTDGDETDEDCGGPCADAGFACGPLSKCKADTDCRGTVPCVDGICGQDGLTKETAAKTCKAIVLHFKDSKNGFYWVTGGNNEFTAENGKGPKKVMCWQEDRDGGGWVLGIKNWYGQHHHFAGGGRRQTNDINSGVMGHLGQYYKMDDREIRAYMGQKDPLNDANNGPTSSMSLMRDQNGHHTGYAPANREYTIMKNYVGRWYFSQGNVISESTENAELSSWAMPSNYDGGLTSVGDGILNWRGEPKCGAWGTAVRILLVMKCACIGQCS